MFKEVKYCNPYLNDMNVGLSPAPAGQAFYRLYVVKAQGIVIVQIRGYHFVPYSHLGRNDRLEDVCEIKPGPCRNKVRRKTWQSPFVCLHLILVNRRGLRIEQHNPLKVLHGLVLHRRETEAFKQFKTLL